MNQLEQLRNRLKKATTVIKYAPFAIALAYLAYYVWALNVPDEIAYYFWGNLHLPIYATLTLAYLSYLLNFCWWHFFLCLMPLILDVLLFGAEFGLMDWANDITYTNIIVGLISWFVITTFFCYKYGWTKK